MAVVDTGKGTTGEVDLDDLERQLREAGGGMYDQSDLEGVLRNISYDEGGISLDDAIANARDRYDERRTNVPGDEDGDGTDDRSGGGGSTSGGGGGGGGGGTVRVGDPNTGNGRGGSFLDGGAAATQRQIQEMMDAWAVTNGGQGFDLPDPPPLPTFTVPGENLSPDIDASLLTLMRGENTPFESEIRQLVSRTLSPSPLQDEIESTLSRTLDQGVNEDRLKKRILGARERMEGAATGALESLRARLGDRGLVSLPGAPQGAETGGTSRVMRRVSEPFAQETGEAITRESELADERELAAVTAATGWSLGESKRIVDTLSAVAGWSSSQSAIMLQAAQSATERQEMLSQVALASLDRNIYWNKFLAEFGLERERVEAEIQQGDQQQVYLMMQLFLNWANGVRGGFV